MNIITWIILYFKEFFLKFKKSESNIESEETIISDEVEENSDINYKILLRGFIKDYSIIDIVVLINQEEPVNLPETLGYKEEYILESNCKYDVIKLIVKCSIKCKDGEILTNLGFNQLIDKGITIINITDNLLGLKAISFGAVTEDFEPVKSTTITI